MKPDEERALVRAELAAVRATLHDVLDGIGVVLDAMAKLEVLGDSLVVTQAGDEAQAEAVVMECLTQGQRGS